MSLRDIATVTDLRAAWGDLASRLASDPALASTFIEDPERALQALGYRLLPAARDALLAALP